jgi:hypothetical protein
MEAGTNVADDGQLAGEGEPFNTAMNLENHPDPAAALHTLPVNIQEAVDN